MKIIGHRGARGLAPENTIAALQKGLDYHADVLEFDLQVTRDHIPVLHHDTAITDLSGQKLLISNHTYAEIKLHKPDVATFQEVLSQIKPSAILYIEVKSGVDTQPITKLIGSYLKRGWDINHLWLASKSQPILLKLQAELPDVPKVVIYPWSGYLACRRARQVNTRYIAMNQLWLWRGFIAPMSRRGWKLMAYTLNDAAKARRWQSYGLFGVITDFPDRF